MAGYSYTRARNTFHRQLKRFARRDADLALLVRGNQTRRCRAARLEYKPREQGLHLIGASQILISAKSLEQYGSEPPHHELDLIYFAGALYRIVEPVVGPRQSDPTVIYYDCSVVYDQKAEYLRELGSRFGYNIDVVVQTYDVDVAFITAPFAYGYTQFTQLYMSAFLQAAHQFGFSAQANIAKLRDISATMDYGLAMLAQAEASHSISADMLFGSNLSASVTVDEAVTRWLQAQHEYGFSLLTNASVEVRLTAIIAYGFNSFADVTHTAPGVIKISAAHTYGFDIFVQATEVQYLTGSLAFGLDLFANAVANVSISANMDYGFEVAADAEKVQNVTSTMTYGYDGDADISIYAGGMPVAVIGHNDAPYVTFLNANLKALQSPTGLPSAIQIAAAWSPNKDWVCIAGNGEMHMYDMRGTAPVEVNSPFNDTTNWSGIQQVAFSHDSQYLACGRNASPYLLLYQKDVSGDGWTKVSAPSQTTSALRLHWKPDELRLAVGSNVSPYVSEWNIPANTLRTALSGGQSATVNSVAYSPDGTHLAVSYAKSNSTPIVDIWRLSDSQIMTITGSWSGVSSTGTAKYALSWNADSQRLVYGSTTTTPLRMGVLVKDTGNVFYHDALITAPSTNNVYNIVRLPDDSRLVGIQGAAQPTLYHYNAAMVQQASPQWQPSANLQVIASRPNLPVQLEAEFALGVQMLVDASKVQYLAASVQFGTDMNADVSAFVEEYVAAVFMFGFSADIEITESKAIQAQIDHSFEMLSSAQTMQYLNANFGYGFGFDAVVTSTKVTEDTFVAITNTATTTWTVPADFASLISVECIGGGGGGRYGSPSSYASGGGGGAYSKIDATLPSLTPSQSVSVAVGAGGVAGSVPSAGGGTRFGGTTLANAWCSANGAGAGTSTTPGTGGTTSGTVGDVKFAGGGGGASNNSSSANGGGGGGAAGPLGAGGAGGAGVGQAVQGKGGGGGNGGGSAGGTGTASESGNGGNNASGNGGGAYGAGSNGSGATAGTNGGGGGGGNSTGANVGGNGTDLGNGYGSGGGGGGSGGLAGGTTRLAGAGGLYGGGSGGTGANNQGGAGAGGIIMIRYRRYV